MDQTGGHDQLGEPRRDVKIGIRRFSPLSQEGPKDSVYTLGYWEGMTLQSALDYIYRVLDPTVAFRPYRCNRGTCMSCVVTVSGKKVQACSTFLNPGDQILIEPAHGKPVIRDLVTAG